jgi:FkbM family methyltransferase
MPSKLLRLALRPFGYSVSKYQPHLDLNFRLVRTAEARGVKLILDVGANRGQFAKNLFKAGYRGKVVSFEPLSVAHAQLLEAASENPNWQVFRRCALGPAAGSARINVAGNTQSSSFLPMLERHVSAHPASRYVGTEETEVVTLDHLLGRDFPDARAVGLKMDVQGYEGEVLKGLKAERQRVALIYTELSLTPLYEGEARLTDVIDELAADGFRCVSLTPNFVDPQSYEVLDVNALFVRDSAS